MELTGSPAGHAGKPGDAVGLSKRFEERYRLGGGKALEPPLRGQADPAGGDVQHPPEGEGLLPGVPAGTRVLTQFQQGTELILNLSPEFQDSSQGGLVGSFATLYSLVNSLTSLPGIDEVRFLVSNQEVLTFRGSHAMDKTFRFYSGAVDSMPPPSPGMTGLPPAP